MLDIVYLICQVRKEAARIVLCSECHPFFSLLKLQFRTIDMNTASHINLARKWRSLQFEQVIGQDISVCMLKNSLYLERLFPVYLFSGQRGCGKTSTARIFASAINCKNFDAFRAEPKKYTIPCLQCDSCQAMLEGRHPDFIEMDAASHTGVDNVRNIIDAASLMPIMGRKKIYLIDEAHMLSKQALNAFLKILEEPPASVFFILATTDPQKIIETVRSRCFQVFFKAIDSNVLLQHLDQICQEESINYEKEGLQLIVKETEGSVRDALNMLESVRFCAPTVSKQAVMKVLGRVEEERIIDLLEMILLSKQDNLLKLAQSIEQSQQTVTFVWRHFIQLLHACIWIKHGVQPDSFVDYSSRLKALVEHIHWHRLHAYVKFCYQQEQAFLKTTNQHAFFVMVLLQLSIMLVDGESGSGLPAISQMSSKSIVQAADSTDEQDDELDNDQGEDLSPYNKQWHAFLQDVATLDDPLIISIFKQATFATYDTTHNQVKVTFSKGSTFFQDLLGNSKTGWVALLEKHFAPHVTFVPAFTDEQPTTRIQKPEPILLKESFPEKIERIQAPEPQRTFSKSYNEYAKKKIIKESPLDIKDTQKWQKAHMLLSYFPGIVSLVQEVKI